MGAINALIYVALQGYAHLDVKLDNMLVGLVRKNGEMKMLAKVSDFGLTKQFGDLIESPCGTLRPGA